MVLRCRGMEEIHLMAQEESGDVDRLIAGQRAKLLQGRTQIDGRNSGDEQVSLIESFMTIARQAN